ncbi:MAG TPA: alcohol dehydrogenase catalytic domain-containing protein [Candidatus Eremiobacteraceae bacterium]|nr:alcohol dehydrogenase catalytic domain-containing protein [Candidatus Eremiobacteraceae bacterium]
MTVVSTTTAAEYGADGTIQLRHLPLDPPKRGELLVRITACGVCPSEVMRWYAASKAPFVLGHEPAAVIEACGEDAGPFGPGERVFVHHHAPCMTCRRCQRGDYVQCEVWRAGRLVPGGMSRYAIVPASIVGEDVLSLPDWVDDDTAVFVEPLATVVKSLRRAAVERGDRVLVIGLGVMGLLHILAARARGVQVILGSDIVGTRRDAALSAGAIAAFDPRSERLTERVLAATDGEGADVVVVGPGSVEALDDAVGCVARGGTIVAFTPLPPDVRWPMPVHDLFFKDVDVVSSYSAGPDDTREALRLLEGGLPVKPLITHRFSLREAAEAYALVARAGEALKVIVYP